MAIIYSYPPNNNILSTDIIVCTSTALVGGKPKNQTKSLSIGSLATFIITSPSNNLNQVLTNGNTSELDAKIGELYLYDGPNVNYAKISIQDDGFSVIRATSGASMFFVDNGYSFTMNNGTANATIINPLTVSRTYTLPDKSGTIALTSDIPSLQQVVNVGNTIAVPTTVAKGIDITLANQTSVFQNGVSVTIPTQTGAFPTYSPAPDAFVANINGQTPGTLIGSVVGFLASAANDDNIGFFADLTTTSGTSRGFEVSSFDAHTGDYFVARKYIVGVDSVVFKVANNGDTTAKSFIKTGGTSDQLLNADGSTSTLTNLVTTNTVQTITASKTFNGGLIFDAEQAAITMHNQYDMGQNIRITLYNTATDPEGLRVDNNNDNGTAIAINNSLSGYGFYGVNSSTGILMTLAASASSTGDLLRCFKNSVITTKVDTNGNITAPSFVKTGGTAAQYLMANGSTSTMPTLQQVTAAGAVTTNSITLSAPGDDVLFINAGNATGVTSDAPEGTAIYASTVNGSSLTGLATGTGDALIVDGGGFGKGATVINGGVNILGTLNPVTGYQLKLSQNSAAKPSTNTWTITSDERVKTNVNPYTKGLEAILSINPITYDYNGKAGFEQLTNNIGIIAQDVLNIMPECINTYKAKLNEDDEEYTELYNFDSHALTFALINAVKELKAEIEILKAK